MPTATAPPRYAGRNIKGEVFDTVLKRWVKPAPRQAEYVAFPSPPPTRLATEAPLLDAQGNAIRGGIVPAPVGTSPPPPPPIAPSPTPSYVADPAPTSVPPPAVTGPPSLLGGLNFDQELAKLLASDPRSEQLDQMQFESIQRDLNAPDFGPEDQKALNDSIALARSEAGVRDKQAENVLAAQNLRGGGTMVKRYQESTDVLARDILQSSIAVRTRALERNTAKRVEASGRAANFARAIREKNVGLATALLQAHQAEVEAGLSRDQMELQKELFRENLQFNRDQFSEDQRARLKQEGFTDRQIVLAEEQQMWERGFRERQQMADFDLANRNIELQSKYLGAQIGQEDRRLAMQEIKNNADISLQERIQQLAETFGFADREFAADQFEWSKGFQDRQQTGVETGQAAEIEARRAQTALDRSKFNQMTEQLEREYGLDLNQFELEKAIRTGELDWKVLESSRRYDLDVEREKNAWLQSQQALALQEKLGMTELEIRKSLGEGQLSVQREEQLLEKWMFQQNLDWNKDMFRQQMAAARRRARGGLFGKILKTVAGIGMGIAGVVTQNPALIAAGASTVFGGSPADSAQIVNSVMGANVATPRTGRSSGSPVGDYNEEPAQYT